MLSKENNDLFNHVEPGAPLHDMMKRYWLPFLRSSALQPDGEPRKVELLGEHYVAFRDSDGRVGLLDEQCPHRGVSLLLARNEHSSLTCIFHGWSFSADGRCLAMPSEDEADERSRANVRVRAFPVREAGGACWVYLGPGEAPAFPDFEFCHLPPEYRRARVGYIESNWTQNLETALDSAHIGLLHKNLVSSGVKLSLAAVHGVGPPKLSLRRTEYGFQSFSRRERSDGKTYLRVTEYLAPFTILNGSSTDEESKALMFIPINDRRTAFWFFYWDVHHTQQWWREHHDKLGVAARFWGNDDDFLAPQMNRSSPGFGQDRQAMARGNWSGFDTLQTEDAVVAESTPIIDRTKENLRANDIAIVWARREVLDGLKRFMAGGVPPGLGADGSGSAVPYRQLRGTSEVIASDIDMIEFHNHTLRQARMTEYLAFDQRLAQQTQAEPNGRRRALLGAAAALALGTGTLHRPARAQEAAYPSRPVKVVVGVAPGGPSDMVTRSVTQHLANRLGQNFVVENRAGGGGVIGLQLLAAAPNDGYTLGWGSFSSLVLRPALNVSAVSSEVEKALTEVTMMADQAFVLAVSPSVQASNLRDLIRELKASPGKYSFGSPGIGGLPHFLGELFKRRAGVDMVHVPHNGDRAAFQGLLRSDIQLAFTTPNLYGTLADQVRLIAVAAPRRSPFYPNVPTFAEEGLDGLGYTAWHALFAPTGTPKPVVDLLDKETRNGLGTQSVRESIERMGLTPSSITVDEFRARLASERAEWRRIVKELDLAVR